MKKFVSMLLAMMLVFALVACGGKDKTNSDEVLIGGLAPQTGGVSQYGLMAMHGAELAVKEANENGGILGGKTIVFNCLDEQGDPTEAISAYNRLVQDGMVALWGDVTTKPTIAVAQSAVEDNIAMITPTATGAEVTVDRPNVFRACFTDPYQGSVLAQYAKDELGAATAAVLYDSTDDYSEGVYEAFVAKAEEIGLEIVTVESYEQGATDFNAQLTKIKNLNPDVVMSPCYYEDASKVISQARALGIESKFLGPDGWASLLGHMEASNLSDLDGAFYTNQYDMANPGDAMVAFMEDFEEAYGEKPDMFACLGYEAMAMLLQAIDTAESTETDDIVEAFYNLDYTGLYGKIAYENSSDPTRGLCVVEFVNGEEVSRGQFGG